MVGRVVVEYRKHVGGRPGDEKSRGTGVSTLERTEERKDPDERERNEKKEKDGKETSRGYRERVKRKMGERGSGFCNDGTLTECVNIVVHTVKTTGVDEDSIKVQPSLRGQ